MGQKNPVHKITQVYSRGRKYVLLISNKLEQYNEFDRLIKSRIAAEKERIVIRAVDSALQKFGDEYPTIIASFRGPYPPASEHNIHIIMLSQWDESKADSSTTLHGFDSGSGRFFSVKIPSKDKAAFLQAAEESRTKKQSSEGQYMQIADTYTFKDSESLAYFFFELGNETNYTKETGNPVYEAAKPVFAAMGADLDALKPRGLPNFFGEKAPQ